MKLRTIIAGFFLLSAISLSAYAAEPGQVHIYINAYSDTCVTIEDTNGKCFVLQGRKATENQLNLSVEILPSIGLIPPGESVSNYRSTVCISGKIGSFTITSENEDLCYNLGYGKNAFLMYPYPGDRLEILASDGGIESSTIKSAQEKSAYTVGISEGDYAVYLSAIAKDNSLSFTPPEKERDEIYSFTVQGAERCWSSQERAIFTSTPIAEDTQRIQVEADTYFEQVSIDSFWDIQEDDWFYSAIEWMFNKKVMRGTSDTTFSPDGTVTRAMMATTLWRMGWWYPFEGNESLPFTDLTQDWYISAIAWAAKEGIVTGYGDGRFAPDEPITREQIAVMLHRHHFPFSNTNWSPTADLSGYSDYGSISPYALEAMRWANEAGIITGRTETILDPTGIATRAELAAMLSRY